MKKIYSRNEIEKTRNQIIESGIKSVNYSHKLLNEFYKNDFISGTELLFNDGVTYEEFWDLTDEERETEILDALISEMDFQEFKKKIFKHIKK